MFRIICFIVFVAINGAIAQSDCVPDPVQSISLALNYTLSWLPSLNCDNTDYIVYVHGEFGLDHIYQIASTSLDVSFLPACERYRFEIVAHSHNIISESNLVDAIIPAPPEADLAITNFNATQNDDSILLQWSVAEKYHRCPHYFRLVIVDSEIRDMYIGAFQFVIDEIVPCTNYQFTVRAIYNLEIEGPITVISHETPAVRTNMPSMVSIGLGEIYVNVTWGLQSYALNRCPITSLLVDGSPYYTNVFPINDSPQRQVTTNLGPLRPDSMYFLRVSIVNNAGTSDPYLLAVQTLP